LVQSGFFVFQPYLLGACGRTTGAAAFAVIGRKDHDCTNQNNHANEIPEAVAPKSACLTPAGFLGAKAPCWIRVSKRAGYKQSSDGKRSANSAHNFIQNTSTKV
jgi:hypothetical protein